MGALRGSHPTTAKEQPQNSGANRRTTVGELAVPWVSPDKRGINANGPAWQRC